MTRLRVAGVDLSLTGLALVAVPVDWAGDVTRIRATTLGTEPKYGSVTRRMRDMARDAATWLEWARVTHIYLEKANISRRQYNLDQAFRLGGMVELAVLELLDVTCAWAPLFPARRLLCGATSKDMAQAALAGIEQLTDEHQRDAFCACNFALHEMGFAFLSGKVAA